MAVRCLRGSAFHSMNEKCSSSGILWLSLLLVPPRAHHLGYYLRSAFVSNRSLIGPQQLSHISLAFPFTHLNCMHIYIYVFTSHIYDFILLLPLRLHHALAEWIFESQCTVCSINYIKKYIVRPRNERNRMQLKMQKVAEKRRSCFGVRVPGDRWPSIPSYLRRQ